MRSIFMLTLMMFALLLGAFYYAFYTPSLVQKAAPAFLEKYVKEVTLNSLQIARQSITYPEVLRLYDIKAEFQWQGQTYQIQIGELDFLNFQSFLHDQQQALLEVTQLSIQRKDLSIADAALTLTVNLEDKAFKNCDVFLRDGQIEITPYRLTHVQGRIAASKESFKVSEFKAQAYGGSARGNIELTFIPKVSESAFVEFSDMKAQELVALHKRFFSQVSGEFSGTLRLSRVEGLIAVLAIFAEIPHGGTLGRAFVKKLSGYIIEDESLEKITRLVKDKGTLDFDDAKFRILKLNENVAGVTISLLNKKENLNINETVNIDMARILQKFDWKK